MAVQKQDLMSKRLMTFGESSNLVIKVTTSSSQTEKDYSKIK
jgi:hypothetical protein